MALSWRARSRSVLLVSARTRSARRSRRDASSRRTRWRSALGRARRALWNARWASRARSQPRSLLMRAKARPMPRSRSTSLSTDSDATDSDGSETASPPELSCSAATGGDTFPTAAPTLPPVPSGHRRSPQRITMALSGRSVTRSRSHPRVCRRHEETRFGCPPSESLNPKRTWSAST